MVVSESALHQQQDSALSTAELDEVHAGPFLQPLDSSTTLWFIRHSSELYVICYLLREHSVIQITSENVNRIGPQIPGVQHLLLVSTRL